MCEMVTCYCCGNEIDIDNANVVEDEYVCDSCYDEETFECDCCGDRTFNRNRVSDEDIEICEYCYDNHYYRCEECECLIHDDDVLHIGEVPYCGECYDEVRDSYKIKSYGYKPTPIFYKRSNESAVRYYGVELEIDDGGQDDDNAKEILETANSCETLMYAKTDGSLGDGMELVSHPCSINFHRSRFPWNDVLQEAVELDYSSHYAETCGLHIHIGRAELGGTPEKQDEVIGRILFFFESHWNEMVKFSRRTAKQLANWATRRGYQAQPADILDDAKKKRYERYTCVNIAPSDTVEIRLFRGTLKFNTFIAALEMVDSICENAVRLTDDEIQRQSWGDFVTTIDSAYTELIQYLKEKRLYINEPVLVDAEI